MNFVNLRQQQQNKDKFKSFQSLKNNLQSQMNQQTQQNYNLNKNKKYKNNNNNYYVCQNHYEENLTKSKKAKYKLRNKTIYNGVFCQSCAIQLASKGIPIQLIQKQEKQWKQNNPLSNNQKRNSIDNNNDKSSISSYSSNSQSLLQMSFSSNSKSNHQNFINPNIHTLDSYKINHKNSQKNIDKISDNNLFKIKNSYQSTYNDSYENQNQKQNYIENSSSQYLKYQRYQNQKAIKSQNLPLKTFKTSKISINSNNSNNSNTYSNQIVKSSQLNQMIIGLPLVNSNNLSSKSIKSPQPKSFCNKFKYKNEEFNLFVQSYNEMIQKLINEIRVLQQEDLSRFDSAFQNIQLQENQQSFLNQYKNKQFPEQYNQFLMKNDVNIFVKIQNFIQRVFDKFKDNEQKIINKLISVKKLKEQIQQQKLQQKQSLQDTPQSMKSQISATINRIKVTEGNCKNISLFSNMEDVGMFDKIDICQSINNFELEQQQPFSSNKKHRYENIQEDEQKIQFNSQNKSKQIQKVQYIEDTQIQPKRISFSGIASLRRKRNQS